MVRLLFLFFSFSFCSSLHFVHPNPPSIDQDFVGQQLAEHLYMAIVVIFTSIGFVVGYIVQSMQTSVIFCGAGFVTSMLVGGALLFRFSQALLCFVVVKMRLFSLHSPVYRCACPTGRGSTAIRCHGNPRAFLLLRRLSQQQLTQARAAVTLAILPATRTRRLRPSLSCPCPRAPKRPYPRSNRDGLLILCFFFFQADFHLSHFATTCLCPNLVLCVLAL
jgi:hypothetical protein